MDHTESSSDDADAFPCPSRNSLRQPRSRPSRTSRRVMKNRIQGDALNHMQISLRNAKSDSKCSNPQKRTVARSQSYSSPIDGAMKQSVNEIFTITANELLEDGTKAPLSLYNPTDQLKAPVRKRSPIPEETALVSTTVQSRRALTDSNSAMCPRRKSMSTMSQQPKDPRQVTRIFERRCSAEASTPNFVERSSIATRSSMTPANRPQRRSSLSQEKSVDIALKESYLNHQNHSTIRSGPVYRTRRRHSTGTNSFEDNARLKELSRSELDPLSLDLSPPKPIARRSLFGASHDERMDREIDNEEKQTITAADTALTNTTESTVPNLKSRNSSTREQRISLPRITNSFSLPLRPKDFTRKETNTKLRRRSRSPSLNSLFRKGEDVSSRSTTERTASTASTEQSTSSWEENLSSVSPSLRPEDEPSAKTAFGRFLSRLKTEEVVLPIPVDRSMTSPSFPNRNDKHPNARSGRRPRSINSRTAAIPTKRELSPSMQSCSKNSEDLEHGMGCSKVAFGTVTIREYDRAISDNPAVSAGTPIGLDWSYSEPSVFLVDHYETRMRKFGPRTRKDFYLTPEQRFHMLLDDWCFSMEEIASARRNAAYAKHLRQISLFQAGPTPAVTSNEQVLDRRAPSGDRASLQNYRLARNPRVSNERTSSFPKSSFKQTQS